MPAEENRSPEEALIQKLTAQYESQLRRAFKKKPRTLEQIEDTAEEVGNQVKRDIQEQVIQEQGTGEQGPHTQPIYASEKGVGRRRRGWGVSKSASFPTRWGR
jgi:hypothetical protein